jgi:hypothetical protein
LQAVQAGFSWAAHNGPIHSSGRATRAAKFRR